MEKFLKKVDQATDHGHCIIKEELMIADSDEEIDVEKVDKEIYSIPKNARFFDSPADFDNQNKSNGTSTKLGHPRTKINSADGKIQTKLDLFIRLERVDNNNGKSQNSTDPKSNREPTSNIKTAKSDTDKLTSKLAKSYCQKCRIERPMISYKARCTKCKTRYSYICKACDKTYKNFSDLGHHLKVEHTENNVTYPCNFCTKMFRYRKGLLYHQRTQHKNIYLSLNCLKCGKKFNTPTDKKQHEIVCDKLADVKSKKCSKCGEIFDRAVNKIQHEKSCGNNQTNRCDFKCDHCPYAAGYKANLVNHILERHSGFREKCKNCPKIFTNQRALKVHTRIYCNKMKSIECDYCGHKFYRKDQIIKHIKHFHMEDSNTDSTTGLTKTCHHCGLTLAHYGRLKYHVSKCKLGLLSSRSSRKTLRICKNCGLTLARGERMKGHMMKCNSSSPSNNDSFKKGLRFCKYCDETMKPREHMRYHVERCESAPLALRYTVERAKLPDMDTALKELAISYCVRCQTKEPLKDGTRRCSKCEKLLRYACVSCPKNFVDTNSLHLHLQRQHVRVLKFYRCDKCRCSYNRERNLIEHQKNVHLNKQPTTNYKCERCGKEYNRKASLRKHKVSCGQEPKFYCDKCPYKTYYKTGIIEHIWAKRGTCI